MSIWSRSKGFNGVHGGFRRRFRGVQEGSGCPRAVRVRSANVRECPRMSANVRVRPPRLNPDPYPQDPEPTSTTASTLATLPSPRCPVRVG